MNNFFVHEHRRGARFRKLPRISGIRQKGDFAGARVFDACNSVDFDLRVAFKRAAKPRGQFAEFHVLASP